MNIDPELLMVLVILAIGLTALAYTYFTSLPKYKHLILSLFILFLLIIALFYIDESFQVYIFLMLATIMIYIFFVNIYPAFFAADYKRLLVDKKKTVWELLNKKPQLTSEGK